MWRHLKGWLYSLLSWETLTIDCLHPSFFPSPLPCLNTSWFICQMLLGLPAGAAKKSWYIIQKTSYKGNCFTWTLTTEVWRFSVVIPRKAAGIWTLRFIVWRKRGVGIFHLSSHTYLLHVSPQNANGLTFKIKLVSMAAFQQKRCAGCLLGEVAKTEVLSLHWNQIMFFLTIKFTGFFFTQHSSQQRMVWNLFFCRADSYRGLRASISIIDMPPRSQENKQILCTLTCLSISE